MPRPRRPWFRFYVEALRDHKLRSRPPADRWLWVTLLGMARASPEPGVLLVGDGMPATVEMIADEAALPAKTVRSGLAYFEGAGMLERDPAGIWTVPKFRSRQFESDDVTARTARTRVKQQRRNVPTASVGTPKEQRWNVHAGDVGTPPENRGTEVLTSSTT